MKYRLVLMPTAELEAKEPCAYIAERSPVDAVRWLDGLLDVMRTLETFPAAYPRARESRSGARRDVRQLVHGRGLTAYRLLFVVAGEEVHVLHVRRAARRGLRRL